MTPEELPEFIAQGESLHSEFKSVRAHPDALGAAFVSFLNSEGGVVLLGVEDDGTISGVGDDVDTARQRIDRILSNNITPKATAYIETISVAGQNILKINLPRGLDRPYHTQRGQCFIRLNAGKRLASRDEMRRLYLAVRAFYYDEVALLKSSLADVNLRAFDEFLNLVYGYPLDDTRTAAERTRLLRNLKAMEGNELTVAGVLCFAHHPQNHMPTARIDFGRFAGKIAGESILDRKEIGGRLPQQLEGIEQLLRLHLRRGGVIRAFELEAQYEIPLEMLREVLVNALVHRDYSFSAPIRILMFDDRLEVHSPGRLPNGITIENIRVGIHVERNPILLSLMAKWGLITRLGTGILRILRLAADNGLPEPGLVETTTEFVVTLYRPIPAPSGVPQGAEGERSGKEG